MTVALAPRDIHRLLDEAPMSRVQITAVMITGALSMLDGYDVLSVSFAAPALVHTWHIGKAALGLVLSSRLLGMAAGSLVLAPMADIWGRRAAVLTALLLMIAGGLMSAIAGSAGAMSISRIVTGLGIGLLVAVISPLAVEFANLKRRASAVSIMAVGYPLGGVIGGFAAAALLHSFGWPSIFVVKSILGALFLPIVLIWLPESPAYLMSRRHPRAIERLSAFMIRCGHGPVATLAAEEASPKGRGYGALFAPGQASVTFRLVAVNSLYAMAAYYVLSWLPQMVADAGYPPSTASSVAAVANLSGVAGGLLLGFAARWIKLRGLVIAAAVGLSISMAAFGFAPPYLPLLTLAAGICGFFMIAGVSGIYTTVATAFDAQSRAAGAGFVIGIGRIASAVAPYLAGWMFASGLGRGQVSIAFAGLALLSALALAIPFKSKVVA